MFIDSKPLIEDVKPLLKKGMKGFNVGIISVRTSDDSSDLNSIIEHAIELYEEYYTNNMLSKKIKLSIYSLTKQGELQDKLRPPGSTKPSIQLQKIPLVDQCEVTNLKKISLKPGS